MKEIIETNGITIKSDIGINLVSLSGREQPNLLVNGKPLINLSPDDIIKLKALLEKISVDESGNIVSTAQINAPAFNDVDPTP